MQTEAEQLEDPEASHPHALAQSLLSRAFDWPALVARQEPPESLINVLLLYMLPAFSDTAPVTMCLHRSNLPCGLVACRAASHIAQGQLLW